MLQDQRDEPSSATDSPNFAAYSAVMQLLSQCKLKTVVCGTKHALTDERIYTRPETKTAMNRPLVISEFRYLEMVDADKLLRRFLTLVDKESNDVVCLISDELRGTSNTFHYKSW